MEKSAGNNEAFWKVWRALGDPTRRRLMDLLREKPRTTGELAQQFSLSRFAVMKHLEVLAEAHLIFVVRQGRQRWNHLNAVPLLQVVDRWLKPFEKVPARAMVEIQQVSEQLALKEQSMSETNGQVSAYEVRLEIRIEASRKTVWNALVKHTSRWWPQHFHTSEKTKAFVIEPKLGGRVYEDCGDGNGAQWATVVVCQPGDRLTMAGDMFPDFGGTGRFLATYKLSDDESGTLVHFHDSGFGAFKPGVAESLETGWRELIELHLKPFAESQG